MCFDGEDPTAFDVETRKARKPHKCCECGRFIEIGETYEHVWGVWDRKVDTFKTCSECAIDRNRIRDHEQAEGCHGAEQAPPFGYLLESLQEYGWERTPRGQQAAKEGA